MYICILALETFEALSVINYKDARDSKWQYGGPNLT